MKRAWTSEELLRHWTLESGGLEMVNQTRTKKNRLGLALLLKWFQYEGRFPRRKQEIPSVIVEFVARQLDISPDTFRAYAWEGRTIERHRALIRQQLGFRETTGQDSDELIAWLIETELPHQRKIDSLIEAVYERCRVICLEPPSSGRIERLVRSAIETVNQRFFDATVKRLSPTTKT